MELRAFIYGLVIALVATPIVRFFASKYGFLDRPDGGRKRHERAMPLLGGLAILVAFAAAAWSLHGSLFGGFLQPKHLVGITVGGAILVLGGALDDRYRLRPLLQLLFPVLAALIVIASGIGADVITNPFGGVLHLDLWKFTLFEIGGTPYHLTLPSDAFTFIWMMGMMYTTKLLDGLDGLVAGLGLIGCAVLAIYSLSPAMAEPELARLAMAAAGALGGFLFFNARPASIFLGEGGSTLVGYLLGTLAILAGAKIGITLMILAVPIMDAGWTILRRVLRRQPIAQGDAEHLHFRLLRHGLGPSRTVLLFWAFAAAFGAAGLFIKGWQKLLALAALGLLFLATSFILRTRPHAGPERREE